MNRLESSSLLPLWFKGVTPDLLQKANLEMGEEDEVKEKALNELRSLVKERSDIHSRTDNSFLLRFLRVTKFDSRKALKIILNYHDFKTKHYNVFTNKKPSDVKHVLDLNCLNYMPYRTKEGCHIVIIRLGKFDTSKATLQDLLGTVIICGELIFECEATQISGAQIILDLKGISYQHYTMFLNVSFLKFALSSLQECWPERVKGIHFVRQPFACTTVINLVRPFMKKKLLERLHMHGNDLKSLHKQVSKELLPEEFGGFLGPFNNKEFASYFLGQEEFISNINKYRRLD